VTGVRSKAALAASLPRLGGVAAKGGENTSEDPTSMEEYTCLMLSCTHLAPAPVARGAQGEGAAALLKNRPLSALQANSMAFT